MTDYEKLEDIYNEINVLIAEEAPYKATSFEALDKKVKGFLQSYYGKDCIEYVIFEKIKHEFYAFEEKKTNADTTESVTTGKEILIVIKKLFEDFFKEMGTTENSAKQ